MAMRWQPASIPAAASTRLRQELAKHLPLRVVFRDAGFKNSAVKINVEQIFCLAAAEVKCI